MFFHIRYMLGGFSAAIADRRLAWCIFRPRGSQGGRADGEIMRRDSILQGRKFTKRAFVESHTIRVENYSLFGEAVIMNPQQAEVMLSRRRHNYELWPKLVRRMSSVHVKFQSSHFVQIVVKECANFIFLLDDDDDD
jgi:hypothetical protein